uniref:Uncharacterized protein n=1 Tax=Acrobeloides nanus TaxID=290746 RepID=A0A914DJL8_9BILA
MLVAGGYCIPNDDHDPPLFGYRLDANTVFNVTMLFYLKIGYLNLDSKQLVWHDIHFYRWFFGARNEYLDDCFFVSSQKIDRFGKSRIRYKGW